MYYFGIMYILKGGGIMKKLLGVISIILVAGFALQSLAARIGSTLANKGVSGTAGWILALLILVAGIIILVAKESKGMTITSIVLYVVGGIIGLVNAGGYVDLRLWSIVSFILAVLLIYDVVKNKSLDNAPGAPVMHS
jgi:hypothetical protein